MDTDSFDVPFKLHETRDSRKVVASCPAVLADFRSQMLVRIRIRPHSAHFDARRLSINLQPSLCPSLVLDCCKGLFALLSTFSGADHFFVMDKTPDTSIATEAFQLRFHRFLGKSITEVCFSATPPWNRILTSRSFLESHHLNGCPSLEVPDAPCTKSSIAFASISQKLSHMKSR